MLIHFDLDNTKEWRPFIDSKNKNRFAPGGSLQISHVQTNAPEVKYSKPKENLHLLEDQIKKYLASKFEDERIAQVKKTTNWNIMISESLKKLLVADQGLETDHLDGVRDYFAQGNRARSQAKGNHGPNVGKDFKPMGAIYTKYFAGKNMQRLLGDFEEYASCARRGGTVGAMRNKDQDAEEDIRVSIVQQVSFIRSYLTFCYFSI